MRRVPLALVLLPFLFAPGAQAALTGTAVTESVKIRPDDPLPIVQSSISLSCAQNEFCAFQIAATGGSAPVTLDDLSLGELTGHCRGVAPRRLGARLPRGLPDDRDALQCGGGDRRLARSAHSKAGRLLR